MSSFIVSSNTSQPLILRDQDLADNQPAKSSYSLNETLNFLILLVSYVHDYTWSLVAHVDGVEDASRRIACSRQARHWIQVSQNTFPSK